MKFLRISFLDGRLCDYFRGVVMSAIAYREENNVFRSDMINLMMEARKKTLQDDSSDIGGTKMSELLCYYCVAYCDIYSKLEKTELTYSLTDLEDDDLVAQVRMTTPVIIFKFTAFCNNFPSSKVCNLFFRRIRDNFNDAMFYGTRVGLQSGCSTKVI